MATVLQPILEPRHALPPRRLAVWDLGFRPFYLLAAALAALSVPLWALQFSGLLEHPWLRGPAWHAHEMIFGYTMAIIVGFLFTAGRNWSGQPTPTGVALAALAALWLAGRVLVLTPYGGAAALVNVALPLLAAAGLWRALRRGGSSRNYFFVGLLVMLALACGAFHLAQGGWVEAPASLGLPMALDVVMFIVAVMGGRVIPMFSNNGVPGMKAVRHPHVEKAALGSVLALLAADSIGLHGPFLTALLVATMLAHTTRLALWQPWKTHGNALVWILHAAYAWLPVHLLLRALAELGVIAPGPATHALTVGLIGSITIGMITRTALGHTGRPLRASRIETTAFALVTAAALVRVGGPLLHAEWLRPSTLLSASLWSAAFVLYLWRYTPWLLRPRADGQPG